MAYVFYKAINQAADEGRIAAPGGDFAEATACDKTYANGIWAGGLTQRGSGEHDGIYLHDAEEMGVSVGHPNSGLAGS